MGVGRLITWCRKVDVSGGSGGSGGCFYNIIEIFYLLAHENI